MAYKFNTKGICVVCGEETMVGPRASKCKECTRAKQKKYNEKRRDNPVYCAKQKKYNKAYREDPVIHARIKEYNKEYREDPVNHARAKKWREDPVNHAKRKKYNKNPVNRARARELHDEHMKDPKYAKEFKQRQREVLYEYRIRKGNARVLLHTLKFNKYKRK